MVNTKIAFKIFSILLLYFIFLSPCNAGRYNLSPISITKDISEIKDALLAKKNCYTIDDEKEIEDLLNSLHSLIVDNPNLFANTETIKFLIELIGYHNREIRNNFSRISEFDDL